MQVSAAQSVFEVMAETVHSNLRPMDATARLIHTLKHDRNL